MFSKRALPQANLPKFNAPSISNPNNGNVTLSSVGSIEQLARLLAPYFLPSSLGTAPLAQGTNGGRRTVLTTASQIVSTINGQSGAVQLFQFTSAALVAGSYTWTFAQPFAAPPIVIPVAVTTSGSGLLALQAAPTTNSVTIISSNGTDTRTIYIVAFAARE